MNPSGTIYICGNTNMKYQSPDTIVFSTKAEKQSFFTGKVIKSFSNQMYTRSTTNGVSSTLNGKLYVSPGTSAVKLNCKIQDIMNADYMYYIEPSYGNKYFYNFITDVSYISDEVTQVTFAEDVFMTWCHDITVRPSYVERETTSSDSRFDDIHDQEDFQTGEMHAFVTGYLLNNSTKAKYLCVVVNMPVYPVLDTEGLRWKTFNMQYACKSRYALNMGRADNLFYYICDINMLNENNYLAYLFSRLIEGQQQGALFEEGYQVINAFMIPECGFSNAIITFFSNHPTGYAVLCPDGDVFMEKMPAQLSVADCQAFTYLSGSIEFQTGIPYNKFDENIFEGYVPNNKKLYSSPYTSIRIKNNWGDAIDFEPQHFIQHGGSFLFGIKTTLGNVCKVNMYPFGYETSAATYNTSYRIALPPYPSIPITVDNLSQWRNQNLVSNALRVGIGVMGSATSVGIGGSLVASNARRNSIAATNRFTSGLSQIESGAGNFASSSGEVIGEAQSIKSRGISTIGVDTDGFSQCAENTMAFSYEVFSIDGASARTVDDYFTMFGYAINCIKEVPFTLNGRTRFHYVQTKNCNIIGAAPMYAKNYIADRYDKGIRLWNKDVFLDYSEFNSLA